MNLSRKKRQFFIACVDVAVLVFSLFASLFIRRPHIPAFENFSENFIYFIPIIAAWIICLYTAGFYSLEPHSGFKKLSYLSIIAVICALLGFAFFYLNLRARVTPKSVLVIYTVIAFVLIAAWREIFNKIAVKYITGTKIAFFGMNNTVVDLLKNMQKLSYMNYKVMFVYADNDSGRGGDNIPVITSRSDFLEKIKKANVQMVVFSDENNSPESVQPILFELLRNYVYFISLPDFYEIFMRRIPIDAVDEIWFLRNIDLRSKNSYRLFKRMADIGMALVLLVITLPFWPFIMFLIKIESPGPVFFRQERIGYLGELFTIIKFRTMKEAGNTEEPTVRDDVRVTMLGNFLRRTRIDEIPQCLNVIKAEMSFIGPRPERPELVQTLEQVVPFYRQRLLVKPGLSGWDQVSGEYHSPSREDTCKKLQYDLYYIKNMSFFLDISIFFKTLVTIVKRAGV
jgi:exopolysaccharide biosynthesis polyprenyl glycosylphosphotransferase